MTRLVLGPLLRHVDERTATVWVETDRPCTVGVLDFTAPTFTLHGHHYALVEISGLEPGTDTPYKVTLDDETVWPEPDSPFPASVIRTPASGGRHRIAFGSCRQAPSEVATHGIDALSAFAHTLAAGGEFPTVLLMIGDQIYADETGERMREFIKARRDITVAPHGELTDFDEYAEQYRLSFGEDPAVRWVLSTVPTLMIFDDHDVRDDWNTSVAWRERMRALPWWGPRIRNGLGSYWVYQHLGNLAADARAADPLYKAVRELGGDGGELLDEFAERADRQPADAKWSYTYELRGARPGGGTRIIVLDSRCRRELAPGSRGMIDDEEQAWFDGECTGGMDHLLIASSLPYLLPPTIHHAEAWDEALADGAWGARGARFGEKLRQAIDLEHWAAFDRTFRTVAAAVTAVAAGERGSVPACISFLGGDVHYSYLARVRGLPITQIVCSPIRNPLPSRFKWANRVASWRITPGPARLVAKLAGTAAPPLTWRLTDGPWFANNLATIELNGRRASVRWQTPASPTTLQELGRAALSRPAPP